MLFCNNCHRITAGEPSFCNFCGRSYNLKLCPHRHPNPRNAEICSTCGSRDLSTPHPRVSLWLTPLLILLSAVPGLLLLLLSVLLLIGLFTALVSDQRLLFQVMMLGLVVAFLWWLYMQLPGFLRRVLSRLFRHRERNGNEH
jgi:RNA polymerase subunit RPABC4/transcription elongation factor Spt4